MKMVSILFLTLICLSSCLRHEANINKASFFKVVSSSYAKELCSCLFVVKQKKEYCRKYAKQIVPVGSENIDDTKKTVTATALGLTSTAIFHNKRLGCGLIGNE